MQILFRAENCLEFLPYEFERIEGIRDCKSF